MKRYFAFDMGKASIGFCVREDNKIKDCGSVIIPKDHASVADNRTRRRAKKTIDAHRAREKWFVELWQSLGLEVLSKDDERFKREFAKNEDDTIYTSCLLRIALLQGIKLEQWQIYKALHNAIQRRGYDSNVAWKSAKTEDDKKQEAAIKEYSQKDGEELIKNEKYKYPCFYDAVNLGLWEESNPTVFKKSIGLNPVKVRTDKVAPRHLVEKELIELWKKAQEQIPQLKKISENYFLYGEYLEAYGSFVNSDWRQYMGRERDWQGVLGQKIPRFNNRVIAKCRLLPKRNVCSADTIENIVFTLLLQLKNLRYIDIDNQPARLAPFEMKEIYENKIVKWTEDLEDIKENNKQHDFTITKTDIENVIGKGSLQKGFEKLKANTSGRSSFCRRALQIMIDIILSGTQPMELDVEKYTDKNTTANPITAEEIRTMLSKVGEWNELFIPDNRNEIAELAQNADIQSDLMIGNITNPVVRNRLQIFKNLLIEKIRKYGMPDKVIFEFVREGADNSLYGMKKAQAAEEYMKKNEKENEKIKELLGDMYSSTNFLKLKLAQMQDMKCIYSGRTIGLSDLSACDIDHIYPRTDAGNDALWNKVICFYSENRTKGGQTPYEWLSHDKKRWAEYVTRVQNLKTKLGKKKATLLISAPEECEKIMESRNGLAETAQVARVAQDITASIMGIGLQVKGENRKIFVNNGSSTHKIRKQFNLNRLLGDDEKKNRENDKHHALDAICISYSQDLKYDLNKHKYIIDGFDVPQIEKVINDIVPFPYTHNKPLKKAVLPLETIYGKRVYGEKSYLTVRKSLSDIEQKANAINSIIDEVIKKDLLEKLSQNLSKQEWIAYLSNYVHPKKQTKVKKVRIVETEGKIETDNNGRERIGEFVDFGTKGVKGQFKHSKQHKGQILYFDEKGKVRVKPIFANKKTQDVKDELIESGYKLYRGGEVYRSGILIQTIKEFCLKGEILPANIYKLRTIKSDGRAKIENSIGNEYLVNLSLLIDSGMKILTNK